MIFIDNYFYFIYLLEHYRKERLWDPLLSVNSHQVSWPMIDLRCDWTEDCPITKLFEIWKVYKPQVDDYIQRAMDPIDAPSYGVPGDK